MVNGHDTARARLRRESVELRESGRLVLKADEFKTLLAVALACAGCRRVAYRHAEALESLCSVGSTEDISRVGEQGAYWFECCDLLVTVRVEVLLGVVHRHP